MDVRGKLVELLKEIVAIQECGFGDPRPTYETVASYLISHGVTVQEWISVNEPPTKQGWYHVAIKDLKTGKYRVENDLYAVETAIAHGHSVGFCKEKAWPERDKLTHWCHYPQPPKGE